MKLTDIYTELRSDMQVIEKHLEEAVSSKEQVLRKTSNQLLKAGGKRLRPVFVLLSGKFGNYDINRLKYIAVSLELIHMATLVHDDVIDNADTRRGKKTVKAKWDNRVAMYTGDYIFAKALDVVTELKDPRIHQSLAKVMVEMCRGEIEQIRDFNNWEQNLKDYLRRIKRKTALLIAVSCKLGALVGECRPQVVNSLYRYGYNVGMAFQITDDILDFTGDEKKLGKPAGSDLRQGNITLPALCTFHHPEDGVRLRDWVKQGVLEENMDEAIDLIRNGHGIGFARQLSRRYNDRAKQAIQDLPDNRSKQSLMEIARFIESRQS
ncbi:MAG: heptaprenyl diphosphate synthase component II [Bacillaceae bacterium]|nr:heptaprenyl diphosphate synthase component II [Bacillaceae bacterium]